MKAGHSGSMTVNEGRVPIAWAAETRGMRIGGFGQAVADKALLETLWRALLVFAPLALVTALGFFFIYNVAVTANRRVLEAGQEKIVQMGRATVNGSLNALSGCIRTGSSPAPELGSLRLSES